jgi:hypothetical protein
VKTMAEVLSEHSIYGFNGSEVSCFCRDRGPWFTIREYSAHQADALTAAGFGPVKAAQSDAWDEGFEKGLDRGEWEAAPVREEPLHANPYRASIEADR